MVACNFNENAASIVNTAGVDFRGCLFRLGPRWKNIRAPFSISSNNNTYLEDILIDFKIGKTNTWGLTRGGSARATSQIVQSGLSPRPSSTVETYIMAFAGATLYSGFKDPTTLKVLNNFYNCDGPNDIIESFGPVRKIIGGTYPLSNENGVPNNYLTVYPSYTDPSSIIADGSVWNGFMVAERIGAWMVWNGSNSTLSYKNTQQSSGIQVYPNPTSSRIFVDYSANNQLYKGKIQIIDMSCKVVKHLEVNDNHFDIDISKLENGYYFIVFKEINEGIVAVEAEYFFKQSNTEIRQWYRTTRDEQVMVGRDDDPPHCEGAGNNTYLEILPDTRVTEDDELIKGDNISTGAGQMAILHYKVNIQAFHCKPTSPTLAGFTGRLFFG